MLFYIFVNRAIWKDAEVIGIVFKDIGEIILVRAWLDFCFGELT